MGSSRRLLGLSSIAPSDGDTPLSLRGEESAAATASQLQISGISMKIGSIKSTVDAAAISATRKADLRVKISELEDEIRKAKKKMGQENIQDAVKTAVDVAEAALSAGEPFCVALFAEAAFFQVFCFFFFSK